MVRVKRSSGVPTMPSRHEDSRHEEGEGGNGENGILNPATLSAPPLWIPTDHLFLCESQRSQRAAAHLREVNIAIHPFIPGLLIRKRDVDHTEKKKIVAFGIRTRDHSKVPTPLILIKFDSKTSRNEPILFLTSLI